MARLIFALMVSLPLASFADVFAFNSVEGFDKCLKTDHLFEEQKAASGAQKRILSQGEIQLRCVREAASMIDKGSIPAADAQKYIGAVRPNSAPENGLPLILAAAKKQSAACNDSDNYAILMQSLSHPKDFPTATDNYFSKAQALVKVCVKDKTFQKDFKEELDSGNSYAKANACALLLAEKLVKTCPGGAK